MRIYFICPERSTVPSFIEELDKLVDCLEASGTDVFYPPRDAAKGNGTSLFSMTIKREVISKADKVYFAWDGEDQNTLIELGLALAYRKELAHIVPVTSILLEDYRSVTSLIGEWSDIGPEKFSMSKG